MFKTIRLDDLFEALLGATVSEIQMWQCQRLCILRHRISFLRECWTPLSQLRSSHEYDSAKVLRFGGTDIVVHIDDLRVLWQILEQELLNLGEVLNTNHL
jgi:hypothetical protein